MKVFFLHAHYEVDLSLPVTNNRREQAEKTPQPAPRRIFQKRQKITGLPLYFQGYLSGWHSRCQEFGVYWTELRGTMLFFYDDKKAPTVSNRNSIYQSALTSATNVYQDENGSAQFILMLSNGELELKANDCECGKEWKGFILTITKLSVPPDESLLPGQLTRVHEVLEKEKKRRITLNNCSSTSLNRSSPPSSTLTTMPACFYAVSQQEAIEMLEKNPSCGNLILRPSSDSKNYAITIGRELDALCLKHYKVMSEGTSYLSFQFDNVTLPSLQDVVNYFVTQTGGNRSHSSYGHMLQRTQCSESKLVAEGTHRNGPAKRKRHEKQHRNSTLLKINRRHSPSYSFSTSVTALLAVNQECDADSFKETYEIWGGQITPIPIED
ncbi:signal-transducing adaptor protein 1 [Nyctibius grandis]|uniref:signal-transducing adaptor protein 1 n=1 Tax=Nyctibius grandis TaxID=48427 RepID=UPI0035BC6667